MTDKLTVNRKGKARLAPTIALAATLGIALAFTISCTTGDGGGNTLYYCQLSSGGCIQTATVSDCSQAGGSITDVCQDRNSSPGNQPSSSSIAPSSSSVAPSSSSRASSSSVGLSACSGGTVTIGSQVWQKCNSNATTSTGNSKCYDNKESNCAIYGRLYDWAAAMALPSNCNSTSCASQISAKHKGICPSGWHIPSNAEWDKLMRYADGSSGTSSPYESPTAGRYLKARNGWANCGPSGSGNSYLCEDTYGFSALPGGIYDYANGSFESVGYNDHWWATNENGNAAYFRDIYYHDENAYWNYASKSYGLSVRCLQD